MLCRLLDSGQGGFFSVAPKAGFRAERRYRGPTNILETTFHCDRGGQLRLTDFKPVYRRHGVNRFGHDVGTSRRIVRMLEAAEAPCDVEVLFKPTFDFGRGRTELELVAGRGVVARAGEQYLVLRCPSSHDARVDGGVFRASIQLRPAERTWLVLSLAVDEGSVRAALDPDVSIRDLQRTEEYWLDWSARCGYSGPYAEAVVRSALTLKLLTYEPTGAVVAAPTTSLPELVGGVRNWDYRYTWLRDASLMLYALSTLGYHEEATDFVDWLARTCADPEVRPQIMYTIDGQRELPEYTLRHLEGYRESRPVRVGNAASEQHQLDIYGDVLSAAYQFRHAIEEDTRTPVPARDERMSRRHWYILRGMVEDAADGWQQPDSGIWEVRAKPRHYVYSKLMCWTAVDRGIRLAQEQGLPAPLDRWRKVGAEIRAAILEHGYNAKLGAFTQVLDGHELDASVLAIPRVGFLASTDPRVQSTVERIRRDLTRNGLVERYQADDGLPGSEGTFALCTFWMVDALALGGRPDEAGELFEHLLSFRNDVGLLAEEIDPISRADTLLGNFPQGFSHMALIGSAVNLAHAAEHGPEDVAHTEAERSLKGTGRTVG